MNPAGLELAFGPNADRSTVARLAERHGSALVKAVRAKRAQGRAGAVIMSFDGHMLVCFDRQWAALQGLSIASDFAILGTPEDVSLSAAALEQ